MCLRGAGVRRASGTFLAGVGEAGDVLRDGLGQDVGARLMLLQQLSDVSPPGLRPGDAEV